MTERPNRMGRTCQAGGQIEMKMLTVEWGSLLASFVAYVFSYSYAA